MPNPNPNDPRAPRAYRAPQPRPAQQTQQARQQQGRQSTPPPAAQPGAYAAQPQGPAPAQQVYRQQAYQRPAADYSAAHGEGGAYGGAQPQGAPAPAAGQRYPAAHPAQSQPGMGQPAQGQRYPAAHPAQGPSAGQHAPAGRPPQGQAPRPGQGPARRPAGPPPPRGPAKGSARPAGPSGKKGGKGAGPSKQTILIVALGGVAVVLVISVLLVLLFGRPPAPAASSSSGPAPYSASQASYDQDAHAIPVSEYADTILPETPDAGAEYVDDTLFIGDSNTKRMLAYRDVTGVTMYNGIGISGMGVTQATTLRCVKFQGMEAVTIPEAVKIMQPLRIVITYGTNDLHLSTENFIAAYRATLEAIEAAWPYADIIIGAVPPIVHNRSYTSIEMKDIDAFNLALVQLAQDMGHKFLNWTEVLKDSKTGYCGAKYMLDDGVHLNKTGMETVFNYLRTHALDSEDTRPKPLKDIPVREGTPAGIDADDRSSSSSATSASSSSSSSSSATAAITFGVNISGAGTVTASPAATQGYAPGTTVSFTATPASGYKFVSWSISEGSIPNAASASASFAIPTGAAGKSYTITANFEAVPVQPTTYNVTINGVASPAEGGSVSGGGTFQVNAGATHTVTLTAAANANFTFAGWSDGVMDASRTVSIVADSEGKSATYTANFTAVTPPATTTP